MTSRLLAALADRPLLLDAGMGTRLIARGLRLESDDPALWNLSHPEAVREVHALDVLAGSDALVTNTFGANAAWLGRSGRAGAMPEINRRAVDLARDAAGPLRFLLGSIGPTASGLAGAYPGQAGVLVEAGVDGLLLETHSIDRAVVGLSALRRSVSLPIFVSLAVASGEDDVRRLADLGADALGMNCVPPATVRAWVGSLSDSYPPPVPLLSKPSASHPDVSTVIAPGEFAEAVPDLLRRGVRLFGGCCGATEAHIAALRAALDARTSDRV